MGSRGSARRDSASVCSTSVGPTAELVHSRGEFASGSAAARARMPAIRRAGDRPDRSAPVLSPQPRHRRVLPGRVPSPGSTCDTRGPRRRPGRRRRSGSHRRRRGAPRSTPGVPGSTRRPRAPGSRRARMSAPRQSHHGSAPGDGEPAGERVGVDRQQLVGRRNRIGQPVKAGQQPEQGQPVAAPHARWVRRRAADRAAGQWRGHRGPRSAPASARSNCSADVRICSAAMATRSARPSRRRPLPALGGRPPPPPRVRPPRSPDPRRTAGFGTPRRCRPREKRRPRDRRSPLPCRSSEVSTVRSAARPAVVP